MIKKFIFTVLGLVVVVGGLVGVKALQIVKLIEAAESGAPPPTAVTTSVAEGQTWQPAFSAVGTTVPVRGVMVTAEIPGTITALGFESGEDVARGQVLVRLDASVEAAQLASVRADLELAQIELTRAKGLRDRNINAPAELDGAKARADRAKASVANIDATIAKKTIRAPFAGQLGRRQVNLGQFLGAGSPVVSVQDLDELYVDFALPQRRIGRVHAGQAVEITIDAYPEQKWTGVVESIDPQVDESTRSVQLRALFDNVERALRPGMFVNVRVLLDEQREVVTVPATSVMYAPYGNSIYVVEESKDEVNRGSLIAKQVFVRLGERRGDLVVIESGIEAGQQIVTTGAFKLRNGAPIAVNNDVAPAPQMDPHPEDT